MSHAVLSPSAAHRWLTCTPCARLEENYPDVSSPFAQEGSIAHEFGELKLKQMLGLITTEEFAMRANVLREDEMYQPEIEEYAEGYTSFVWERYQAARKDNEYVRLRIEERIDLRAYVPEGFGTGDAIILSDGTMDIIDLKYGKGVKVSAVENPQMMIYAIGALYACSIEYEVERVRMTIYQPRLGNVSEWEITASALKKWAKEELMPKALMAYKGEGEPVPGSHCKFCKAKAQCRALAQHNVEASVHEFDDAHLLSIDAIAELLHEFDGIKTWIAAVEEYALAEALKGTKVPGWKLVEGRSVRKYKDDKEVAKRLLENGITEDAIYKPRELNTITTMEKRLTKKGFNALLADLVIKPAGKPTLVTEDDARPEYNSAANDFNGINV